MADLSKEINIAADEADISNARPGRIRYADDVEHHPRRGRARSQSRDSMSIRSLSRGRRTVEPSVALPVQYRTL
jgi:hypothetical protein